VFIHLWESRDAAVRLRRPDPALGGDLKERDRLLREIGNYLYEEYATVPLFWLFAEFVVNPNVGSDYKTSGLFPPRHLEYVKAAR
jgi:hypothetical protein